MINFIGHLDKAENVTWSTDEEKAEIISRLEKRLHEDPSDSYANQMLLNFYRMPGSNTEDRLRIRNNISLYCASDEGFWTCWIEEQKQNLIDSSGSFDQRTRIEKFIINLYRKALTLSPTVGLWIYFMKFLRKAYLNLAGDISLLVKEIRRCSQSALKEFGFHSTDGPRLWAFYRRFETQLLDDLLNKQESVIFSRQDPYPDTSIAGQVKRIRNIFRRQMHRPLSGLRELLDEYKLFEAELPPSLATDEDGLQSMLNFYNKSVAEWELRKPYELSVLISDIDQNIQTVKGLSDAWDDYILFEKNRISAFRNALVYDKYSRACEDLGHIREDLWMSWWNWVSMERKYYDKMFSISKRAVRFHRKNLQLWLRYIYLYLGKITLNSDKIFGIFLRFKYMAYEESSLERFTLVVMMIIDRVLHKCCLPTRGKSRILLKCVKHVDEENFQKQNPNIIQKEIFDLHSTLLKIFEETESLIIRQIMTLKKQLRHSITDPMSQRHFYLLKECWKTLLKFNSQYKLMSVRKTSFVSSCLLGIVDTDMLANNTDLSSNKIYGYDKEEYPALLHSDEIVTVACFDEALICFESLLLQINNSASCFQETLLRSLVKVLNEGKSDFLDEEEISKSGLLRFVGLTCEGSKDNSRKRTENFDNNFLNKLRCYTDNLKFMENFIDESYCLDCIFADVGNKSPNKMCNVDIDSVEGVAKNQIRAADNLVIEVTLGLLRSKRERRRRSYSESESDFFSDTSSDSGSVNNLCCQSRKDENEDIERLRSDIFDNPGPGDENPFSSSQRLSSTPPLKRGRSLSNSVVSSKTKLNIFSDAASPISQSSFDTLIDVPEPKLFSSSGQHGLEPLEAETYGKTSLLENETAEWVKISNVSLNNTPGTCSNTPPLNKFEEKIELEGAENFQHMKKLNKRRVQRPFELDDLTQSKKTKNRAAFPHIPEMRNRSRTGKHYLQLANESDKIDHLLGKVDQSKTVYISNLDRAVKEADIQGIFEDSPGIQSIRLVKDFKRRPKGYCYVDFDTEENALKAVERKKGYLLRGRELQIIISSPNRPIYEENVLFISNLDQDFVNNPPENPEDIIQYSILKNCNENISIKTIRLLNNASIPGSLKSYGFLEVNSKEDAIKILQQSKNGCMLDSYKSLFYVNPSIPIKQHRWALAAPNKAEKNRQKRNAHKNKKSDSEVELRTLFVKNLNFKTNEESLEKFFRSVMDSEDSIVSVYICKDTKGLSKGYGFVVFKSEAEAFKAKILNEAMLDGRALIVSSSSSVPTISKTMHSDVNMKEDRQENVPETGDGVLENELWSQYVSLSLSWKPKPKLRLESSKVEEDRMCHVEESEKKEKQMTNADFRRQLFS